MQKSFFSLVLSLAAALFLCAADAATYSVSVGVGGGGTVSGSGRYAPGTTVTLVAKPKSGWAFTGYWFVPECGDCGPGKTVKMSGNTYSFKMASHKAVVLADFVRKSDDVIGSFSCDSTWFVERRAGTQTFRFGTVESISKVSYSVSGLPKGIVRSGTSLKCTKASAVKPGIYSVKLKAKNMSGKCTYKTIRLYVANKTCENLFPGLDSSFDGYRLQVGVPLDAERFSVYPSSGWRVTASGLPKGVKWNAALGRFTGVPRKKGNYVVSLKGVKGKTTKVATAYFIVAGLPSNLVGTYNGRSGSDGDEMDYTTKKVTVKVASDGKITAKIGSVSFSRVGFSSKEDCRFVATLTKKVKITSGSNRGCYKVYTVRFAIDPDCVDWTGNQLEGEYQYQASSCSYPNAPLAIRAQRNPFGRDSKGKYKNSAAGSVIRFLRSGGSKLPVLYGKIGSGGYDLFGPACTPTPNWPPRFYVTIGATGKATLSGSVGSLKLSGSTTVKYGYPESAYTVFDQGVAYVDFLTTINAKAVRIHMEFNPDSVSCRHGWLTVGKHRLSDYYDLCEDCYDSY